MADLAKNIPSVPEPRYGNDSRYSLAKTLLLGQAVLTGAGIFAWVFEMTLYRPLEPLLWDMLRLAGISAGIWLKDVYGTHAGA